MREEWEGDEENRTESIRVGLKRRRRRSEKMREQAEQMVEKYVRRKRWKREEMEQVHDSKVDFLKPLARIWQNPNEPYHGGNKVPVYTDLLKRA